MITKSEGFGNCGHKIHTNFGENAFDRMNIRGNYRIATVEYNTQTNELTINQYPDVSKTVILGDSSVSRNTTNSHKDVIQEILDWANMSIDDFNNLDKDKNYVIYNANNPESERYLYYSYDKPKGEWLSTTLLEGDEFFNASDDTKYRFVDNKLVNIVDVKLTARNTVIDGKSTGITLEVSPTTGDSVHLDLVGEQYAGLMSPEDKVKLDSIGGKIGAVLELGNPASGKVPLYLKTEDGQVLSMVNLDEDDYIDSIVASVATEDDPDHSVKAGDRILTFTITNGKEIIVSLEGWFLKYKGVNTNSILTNVVGENISSDLKVDPSENNLINVSQAGVLAALLWSPTLVKEVPVSVRFIKGAKSDYSSAVYAGYIYFATDTKEVIVDGIAYGLDLSADDLELVKKIELGDTPGSLKLTNSNGTTYVVTLPLSTSEYNGLMSSQDKDKLDTVERNAQVNVIEGVKIGSTEQPISNKIVTLDVYSKGEMNNKLFNSFRLKGTVEAFGLLPSDSEVGDTYIVNQKVGTFLGASVYWTGEAYVPFSGNIDLSDYATKEDLQNQSGADWQNIQRELDKKVDKVDGKQLSTNDYTNSERNKLGNLDSYVKDVSETIVEGKINLDFTTKDSITGNEVIEPVIVLSEAATNHNGLMTSEHYNVVEALQINGNYLDKTGTPSLSWQLSKNTGPKIKVSGQEFGLRNSTDDDYTGLTVKNLTITGDVTQLGSSFISQAETVEVVDNTILLNKNEPGAGVTKGYAGIEVDRGSLPQYNIYFDESDDRFKAGVTGGEQPIMLRDNESNLSNGSILVWDSSTKLAKTGKNLDTELNKYLPLAGGLLNSGAKIVLPRTANGGLYVRTASADMPIAIIYDLSGQNTVTLGNSDMPLRLLSVNSNPTINGNKIWNENNDGADSGLDADTLDGKHASEFAPYAVGGYLPLEGGPDYPIINTLHSNNDIYTNGSVHVNYGLYAGTFGTIWGESGVNDSTFRIYSQGTNSELVLGTNGTGTLRRLHNNSEWSTIWDSGNDGAGSGLDADLLDGKQGSEYALTSNIPTHLPNPYSLTFTGSATGTYNGSGNLTVDIPVLSGGAIATANQYINSVVISGHNITVGKGTLPTSLPASDVYGWAKQPTKPTYTAAEVGAYPTTGGLLNGALTTNNPICGALGASADATGYGAIVSTRPNANGLCHYGFVRAGIAAYGLGLNGNNRLIYGVALSSGALSGGNELAYTSEIPSLSGYATQSWVQSQGYLTSHQSLDNYVTLNSTQTISGAKTFSSAVIGTAGFYDTSDIRLKTNIKDIDLNPEKIKLYEFDKKGSHSYGVIAQEVEELYPSTVKENEEGYKVVNYNEVLTIKCAELEAENKALKGRLDKLEQLLINSGII